jgi:hypothetical protein
MFRFIGIFFRELLNTNNTYIKTWIEFYILLTVHIGIIHVNNQLDALFNVFISLFYMFRATQCPSSGESIVSIHHLVYILSDLHTRRPPTQSDIYQMMY